MHQRAMSHANVDPILAPLADQLLYFVEDQLSNNDVASDAELHALLVLSGLTVVQAAQALRYRSIYLCNLFLQGHTPIRKNKHAIRFDPHRQQFERIGG